MTATPERADKNETPHSNDNEPLPFVSIGEAARRVLARLAAKQRGPQR